MKVVNVFKFLKNVFIHLLQAKFDHDMPCETVSKINLVDLAGRYMLHFQFLPLLV